MTAVLALHCDLLDVDCSFEIAILNGLNAFPASWFIDLAVEQL